MLLKEEPQVMYFTVNVDWKQSTNNLSFNRIYIHVRKPNFQRFFGGRGAESVNMT
jgi:hypothetical protein